MEVKESPDALQSITFELEKRYASFKKIDIFKAVSNACKKVNQLGRRSSTNEIDEIKNLADQDLSID